MRILIFGAGAVGQAVGCMLAADGHNVDLILRERYLSALRSQGLTVTGIFGEYRAASGDFRVFTDIENVSDISYDYALITTKSYNTDDSLDELEKLECQQFTVVSMQNGCGNLEKVVERFGEKRSLGGRVITGFEIEHPGLVRITVTADDIHIGGGCEDEIPDSAVAIAEAINSAGLPCTCTPFIKRDLFAKLLYNCALNPLGAVLGVHYGALGDDPEARKIMDAVISEVFAVINAMGAATHWKHPQEYGAFFYEKQIPATYNHRSSMLQDLEVGKRTEVEALTGYVSAHGHRLNVPTPICDMLSELIRFRERNNPKRK